MSDTGQYLDLDDRPDRRPDDERWRDLVESDGPDRWKNVILAVAIGAMAFGFLGLIRTGRAVVTQLETRAPFETFEDAVVDPVGQIQAQAAAARRADLVSRDGEVYGLAAVAIALDLVAIAAGVGLLVTREWGRRVLLGALAASVIYTVIYLVYAWDQSSAHAAIDRTAAGEITARRGQAEIRPDTGRTLSDISSSLSFAGTLVMRLAEIAVYLVTFGTLLVPDVRRRLLPPPRPPKVKPPKPPKKGKLDPELLRKATS